MEVSRYVPLVQESEPKARASKLEEATIREPRIVSEKKRESISTEKEEKITRYNQTFGTAYGEWLGLDYKVYTAAVAGSESARNGYSARNDLTGIEL